MTTFYAEETLTADLVPMNVDAVLFWHVWDAAAACTEVGDFTRAVENSSTPAEEARSPTTSVDTSGATRKRRSSEDFSLPNMGTPSDRDVRDGVIRRREQLDRELKRVLEEKVAPWGVTVLSVEVRDILLPRHCWATWHDDRAISPTIAAPTIPGRVTAPTISQVAASAAAKAPAHSTAENTSTPVLDARSPATSVVVSGHESQDQAPEARGSPGAGRGGGSHHRFRESKGNISSLPSHYKTYAADDTIGCTAAITTSQRRAAPPTSTQAAETSTTADGVLGPGGLRGVGNRDAAGVARRDAWVVPAAHGADTITAAVSAVPQDRADSRNTAGSHGPNHSGTDARPANSRPV